MEALQLLIKLGVNKFQLNANAFRSRHLLPVLNQIIIFSTIVKHWLHVCLCFKCTYLTVLEINVDFCTAAADTPRIKKKKNLIVSPKKWLVQLCDVAVLGMEKWGRVWQLGERGQVTL